jgi:hypothetical protein
LGILFSSILCTVQTNIMCVILLSLLLWGSTALQEYNWVQEIHGARNIACAQNGSLNTLSFSCGVLCFGNKGNSLTQQYWTQFVWSYSKHRARM